MFRKTDGFSKTFQVLLVIINVAFFLAGVVVFVLGAFLKWSDLLSNVKAQLENSINIQYTDFLFIFFLVFGAVIMNISLLGIISAYLSNRCFLILYLVITGLTALAHFSLFVTFLALRYELRDMATDAADKFTSDIYEKVPPNSNVGGITFQNTIADQCTTYKEVTDLFKCCDFNRSAQFQYYANACCPSDSQGTCPDRIYAFVELFLVVLPNMFIIVFELVIVALAVAIIVKMRKYVRSQYSTDSMGYY